MDFALDQTQEDVQTLARKIFADHRDDSWRFVAEAGLLEGGLLETCVLLEEQGRATAPAPLWSSLCGAALPIAAFGTAAQRALLAPLARGEIVIGAALDGELVWGGAGAHRIVVAAEGERLCDPRALALEPVVATTGETLHRVRAPAPRDDVIPAPLEWVLARATVGLCALQLGVAERALAMTAAYTSTRRQFDRPIATFQAVAQRAADAYIDVEVMRLSMWQAAWLLAEGRDDEAGPAVSRAKLWACEGGHRVAYAAQHLHGGIGFDADYPLGRGYLWSKQLELTLGSASAHLARLGAELARR